MKNTKIFALVATVALLALGTAFTSFAAAKYNWYQVDGIWHCANKDGDDICDEKAKSGNDWYYLDENGEMIVDALVEIDDDLYYFDETGKMVTNDWKKIENTEEDDGDEYYWYYFTASGKAKKNTAKPVSINGKKYMFNSDSHMMYGWLLGDTDDDYAWQTAKYYAGDAEDGAIKTGWQKIDVLDNDPDLDFEEQTYWFYFGTDGVKVKASSDEKFYQKSINGKTYAFDEYGVMKAEWEPVWDTATDAASDIKSYAWFRTAEEGARLNKGWFRVIPNADVNDTDNEEETAHWYYALGGGKLAKSQVKTVSGKKYAFNEKGEMMAGLIWLVLDEDNNVTSYDVIDEESKVSTVTSKKDYKDAGALYFFGDEETDGSMKTGTIKTEIDGEEYTFLFNATGANKFKAVNGWKGNYWYINGSKLTADADYKYQAFEATGFDTENYKLADLAITSSTATSYSKLDSSKTYVLLSSTGAVVKNGKKKDADEYQYIVTNYKVSK